VMLPTRLNTVTAVRVRLLKHQYFDGSIYVRDPIVFDGAVSSTTASGSVTLTEANPVETFVVPGAQAGTGVRFHLRDLQPSIDTPFQVEVDGTGDLVQQRWSNANVFEFNASAQDKAYHSLHASCPGFDADGGGVRYVQARMSNSTTGIADPRGLSPPQADAPLTGLFDLVGFRDSQVTLTVNVTDAVGFTAAPAVQVINIDRTGPNITTGAVGLTYRFAPSGSTTASFLPTDTLVDLPVTNQYRTEFIWNEIQQAATDNVTPGVPYVGVHNSKNDENGTLPSREWMIRTTTTLGTGITTQFGAPAFDFVMGPAPLSTGTVYVSAVDRLGNVGPEVKWATAQRDTVPPYRV
ncbi:MAG: hypothetical protein FD127_4380, partial [Acidimicrobiaceae bacterium]